MHNFTIGTFLLITATAIDGLCPSAWAEPPADAGADNARLRQSVARALPYLRTAGESWMRDRKCSTCHRVTFLTWAHGAALEQGFDVDRQKLSEWVTWSHNEALEKLPNGEELKGTLNVDGLAQMILGSLASLDGAARQKAIEPLLPVMLKMQRTDGSWQAGGQLPMQKRPKPETDQVTTMWVALSLSQLTEFPAAQEAQTRAVDWLDSAEPGKSTEWFSTRLLLDQALRRAEATAADIQKLRALQNTDGGWGWLLGDTSDALATGQSLYALAACGIDANDPGVAQAREYLIASQQDDGSWAVPGTKLAKKDRVEETATYWGTAWAVIGLLKSVR